MALWTDDLTTRDGALGAAQQGGFACFFQAGRCVLGAVMTAGLLAGAEAPDALYFAIGGGLEALVLVIAGFRLRAGRGLVWGGVAVALILVELLGKLAAFSLLHIGGMLIDGLLMVAVINGLRGAWALRRDDFDPEETAAIFE